MKKKKVVFNGLFLTQRVTGIQRFGREILRELDILAEGRGWEVLVPENSELEINFRNLKIVRYGKTKGFLWEQWSYPMYLLHSDSYGVNLCNVLPILRMCGIIVIHDISYKVNPTFFTGCRGKLSALWHRLQYWLTKHSKMRVICVSNFTKNEIMRVYRIPESRLSVIYNGWQHMQRVREDIRILDITDKAVAGQYFFSLATLAKNKNFAWILQVAHQYPDETFLVAGGGDFKKKYKAIPDNVEFLGYVTDGEAKALMHYCKAFLFPTIYEGFGIPPLEAVASGADQIVVSDTPCMHEIYGEYANYVSIEEPCLPKINIKAAGILEKYSWEKSARRFFEILTE